MQINLGKFKKFKKFNKLNIYILIIITKFIFFNNKLNNNIF